MQKKIDRIIQALNDNSILSADLAGERLSSEDLRALAAALRTNTSLTRLVLGGVVVGCHITNEDVGILADAISNNHTLLVLDLRANQITDEGAITLAQELSKQCHLTQIDLRSNDIGQEGSKAFSQLVKSGATRLTVALDQGLIHTN